MSLHAPRPRSGGLPTLIKMAAMAAAICVGLWSAVAAGQAAAAGGRHHRGRHHRNHRRHRGVHTARHALAHASSASAPCTVFVSASGDASSTGGSAGSPTSFSAALARVGPGSVVCLQAGSYDIGSNVVLSRSGSASSPIIYRSFGGTTLLRYTGGSLDGGLLQTSRGNNWGGAHDIVIEGLTIDGAEKIGGGIFVSGGSHHITIQNCVIRNTGSAGIEVNAADYVTVTHNVVYRAGYNQGWSSGIDLWYGGSNASYGGASAWYDRANAFHNVIADNIVAGSYDNSSNHSDGNGIIVDGSGSIPPALIVNNLVYENGGRGIEINENSGDIWVVNNTAYANGLDLKVGSGQAPDFMAMDASNVHFVNDLAYGRRDRGRYATAYTYMNVQSTISWSHDLSFNGSEVGVAASSVGDTNPRFTSAPPIPSSRTPWSSATAPWSVGKDFTLRRHSRARRAGINPSAAPGMTSTLARTLKQYISTDLGGHPRGAKIDIGAY